MRVGLVIEHCSYNGAFQNNLFRLTDGKMESLYNK